MHFSDGIKIVIFLTINNAADFSPKTRKNWSDTDIVKMVKMTQKFKKKVIIPFFEIHTWVAPRFSKKEESQSVRRRPAWHIVRPRIAIVVVVASHRIGGGNVKFKVLCPSRRRSMAAAAAQKPCAAALCRSYPSSDSKRGLRAEQKPSATQSGLRKKSLPRLLCEKTSFVFSTQNGYN